MMTRNDADRVMIECNSRYYFHPGYYIQELVEESGLSQQDFARELGVSHKTLGELIDARQDLTTETATRLARIQQTSARYWLNLQASYDAALDSLRDEGE